MVHTNAGLGNSSGITDTYQHRPAINGLLDLGQKLQKAFYNQGCRKYFDGYGVDAEGRHVFVAALKFEVKRFSWGGDYCRILDIPTDEFMTLGGQIHKYLLKLDGKFTLLNSKDYVGTYVDIPSREAQDNEMLFESIINSLSSNGKYKVYNRSEDFYTLGEESGVLLTKTTLEKSGLQTYATVMKEKDGLDNLPELMI